MHLMVSIMCLAKDSDKSCSISKLLTWFLQILSIFSDNCRDHVFNRLLVSNIALDSQHLMIACFQLLNQLKSAGKFW